MTAVVVHLFGRPVVKELPPLVTTAAPELNLCDQPVVSARCASLIPHGKQMFPCSGLLAYQSGSWQHVNACDDCYDSTSPCPAGAGHRSCDTPQPVVCMHGACTEPADVEIQCTSGAAGECCGCCWISAGHTTLDDAAGWAPTQSRWAE